MKKRTMVFAVLSILPVFFLSGCLGPQATVGERVHDSFVFSSATNIQDQRCIMLTQPFILKSGAVTYTLPAGKYIAKKKNDSGYFYYAPSVISCSNWLISGPQQGIYLNNQLNQGNIFGINPDDFLARPVRGAVLPNAIFKFIKKSSGC